MPGKLLALMRAFFRWTRQRMHQARTRRAEPWLEMTRNSGMTSRQRRAQRRTLCLLLRLLNPEQRREFREHRHFHVTGAGSRDRYRIRMEAVANIDVLDDGDRVKHRLCVRPAGGVPLHDVMASQLLQLQDPVAERLLLQQANVIAPPPGSRLYCEPAMLT